ncbi:acyl-CoA N-acyltransferase [Aspergillus japonicus CBS 114.51]|uniref:Acyl-CoA N-acyltransferase n=2 Tax=Aspergillus TaxID=5052 RepID=A0A2V5GZD4_ASPV1|nr:acyl-CoA N-acyltransferase [Aspergillus japonicus CBS 114.51]PYI16561.1 acyl-CoA N-acyltransferase [Aspergillus violaceofuscus CBS 115571]RAH79607.1 acyl-CoA N-acyltransferase [Aspergillus japonicus CBS 114.51]
MSKSTSPLDTSPAIRPTHTPFGGRFVRVEPLAEQHVDDLYHHIGLTEHTSLWDYLPFGPFADKPTFTQFLRTLITHADSVFYAVVDLARNQAVGLLNFMRIDLPNRVVEIGSVVFSPLLQRTTAATEALYLLARAAFEQFHFRRLEWKCNDLNAASKRAAVRLGFTAEGVFRQHLIVKGRNRDTAWFSILDGEWPAIKGGFVKWLDPSNFDEEGLQRARLEALRGL